MRDINGKQYTKYDDNNINNKSIIKIRYPSLTGITRHLNYSIVPKKAFICIGVRRYGKSTFLYQIIENLKKNKNVKKENIIKQSCTGI